MARHEWPASVCCMACSWPSLNSRKPNTTRRTSDRACRVGSTRAAIKRSSASVGNVDASNTGFAGMTAAWCGRAPRAGGGAAPRMSSWIRGAASAVLSGSCTFDREACRERLKGLLALYRRPGVRGDHAWKSRQTHPVTNLRPPAPLRRPALPSCRRTKLSRVLPARGALGRAAAPGAERARF